MTNNSETLIDKTQPQLISSESKNNLHHWQTKLLSSWERVAFWLILAIAAILRLYKFPNLPAGLWVDEATNGYDAYSLLQNGTDRWGNRFPIYFPNWGSGQNVLEAYLSIPFIKLFGLNLLSIRIVPVTLGILAIPLLYFTVKKVYGVHTGLLAAFLMATLPWHLMVSRWSMESNLLPFFFLLNIATLLYCYDTPERQRWIPLSLIPLALSFYAYGTALVPATLFLLSFWLFNYKTIWHKKWSFLASLVIFLIIATPFFLFILENYVLHKQIRHLSSLPFSIPLFPSNRLDQVNEQYTRLGILKSNLRFLISGYQDGWTFNSVPWISALGWLVPPFSTLGLYFSLKQRPLSKNLFVFWLIAVSPLFILFIFTVHRSNSIYVPLIVLGAYGIVCLLKYVQPLNNQIVVTIVLVGTIFLPNMLFYQYYFTDNGPQLSTFNADNAAAFNAGFDSTLQHALSQAHKDEHIYINTNHDWATYADTLFYLHPDPKDFYTHADTQIIDGKYWVLSYNRFFFGPFAPVDKINQAPSYVAVLKTGFDVSCQRKDVLYVDNTWPNDTWTVVRCFPDHSNP
ncbi:ArnT family glycosyltransferase [Tengunoibacter tsumagoiensis]|uniref:Glycosyltransferase RgtA/B/C/D-like domain-containing protein n=1 Tax=Tengunoibacter tsumagoiensis TaxID=2014871 RepID=A0A401ZUD3_9CHLR|nr:glycosyltransferase family 39 protein [Tengunoibacter tsumagoiensis]GCE10525.1 hypothetical protein KTT_03840 [Tengunoibacter tsumagoiensis]